MTAPFLLRVFTEQGTQVTPYATEASARHALTAQLDQLPDQSTVELWRQLPNALYELLEGHDKLYQPVVYTYDASMLDEDVERVRWDGSADTYLYQSETF